ncbi:uncharacterized protein N7483_002568 [Penicillium malachiteum]|uniref:uncharacterized protein n=1 Tax=Penicillium malachiteum TaxID=1324776 RepID=UPI0025489681|nr:uncharacterized protein N7483_002568 [Penicillium malachiteum]KAJ5737443.1 hypothetical protein N7483_002568 [Penicillium malachiteum]
MTNFRVEIRCVILKTDHSLDYYAIKTIFDTLCYLSVRGYSIVENQSTYIGSVRSSVCSNAKGKTITVHKAMRNHAYAKW